MLIAIANVSIFQLNVRDVLRTDPITLETMLEPRKFATCLGADPITLETMQEPRKYIDMKSRVSAAVVIVDIISWIILYDG